jgi:NAD(P)-dependent dehydrogenase (short-subunit alcohol dehydrogenase family)
LQNGTEYNPWLAYGQSKSANILFSSALARKLKGTGVEVFSLNPGCEIMILERAFQTSFTDKDCTDIPSTNLQGGISKELFAEGGAIAYKNLNGDPFPGGMMTEKTLAQGTSTIITAALNPSLSGMELHPFSVLFKLG